MIKLLFGIIAVVLMFVGVYMLLCGIYQVPTSASVSVLPKVASLSKDEQQSTINKMFHGISKKFAPMITLSPTSKYKLQTAMEYMHYTSTPEEHYVEAITAGVLIGLVFCLLGLLHPFFFIVAIIAGFIIFKVEIDDPISKMDTIRDNIESDSSYIAKFIADELKDGNRNVIDILMTCKNSVSKDYRNALEMTIAEMKTGNQEQALINMGKRINSPNVTQIVTGLIGVLRGDNQTVYFEALADKFYKAELTAIKKKNALKPDKVSKLSMILLIAVVGQILVGMILYIVDLLGNTGLF